MFETSELDAGAGGEALGFLSADLIRALDVIASKNCFAALSETGVVFGLWVCGWA